MRPPRATLAILALASCALGAPAAGAAAPGGDAPAAVARLQAADAAAQDTSAQLALLRTRARTLSGAALRRNRARQGALERRKLRLLDAVPAARADAARALDRHREAVRAARRAERAAARADVPPAVPAGAYTPSTPPAPDATAPAAHAGDDAALARAIDAYLASKASPLTGHGADFVRSSRAVGLDPRFLVAIAGAETSFATYGPSQAIRNPFGMGPGFTYATWTDAIDAAARNLGGDLYLGDGRVTIADIHARWAPVGASDDPTGLNGHWPRNVGHYYAELGGDPSLPVFGAAPAAAGPPPVDMEPAKEPARPPETGDRVGPGMGAHAAPAPQPEGGAAPAPAGPLLVRVFAAPAGRGPIIDAAAP